MISRASSRLKYAQIKSTYLCSTCIHGGDYLYPVGVVVQQQNPGARHLLGLHHRLQVSQQTHVLGHVRGQNLKKRERTGISTVWTGYHSN